MKKSRPDGTYEDCGPATCKRHRFRGANSQGAPPTRETRTPSHAPNNDVQIEAVIVAQDVRATTIAKNNRQHYGEGNNHNTKLPPDLKEILGRNNYFGRNPNDA